MTAAVSLADHLDPAAVLLRPAAADKWALLEVMVAALVRAGRLPAERAPAAAAAVAARERSVSTGMEFGIAVPHASLEGLERVSAALALLPDGLEFDSLDGRPTEIVVLLLVPKNEKLVHLRALTEIARRLNDPAFRARLLAVTEPEQAVALWR